MKDYYAILGVVPTAADVVIRAAYKALAQQYHPDRFAGDPAEAHARMSEINEAYKRLSDPERRKDHDRQRGTREGDFGDWMHEEEADRSAIIDDDHEKVWSVAMKYYPDLDVFNSRLASISQLLAFSFRAHLVESRAFDNSATIAKTLETDFLKTYFGKIPAIVEFARELVLAGERKAARELNEAVRILGGSVQPHVLIERICASFDFKTIAMRESEARAKAKVDLQVKQAEHAKAEAERQAAREAKAAADKLEATRIELLTKYAPATLTNGGRTPTMEELLVMSEFDISYDGQRYLFSDYRYERLDDAVNYAKLNRERAGS